MKDPEFPAIVVFVCGTLLLILAIGSKILLWLKPDLFR
jgi:hypothetical protein